MDPEHFDSVIDGSHWAGLNKDVILPAIRCPVLLIYCPSNEADARDHAQNLAQSAVLISDVNNHRIHELDPEAYTQYVQQFITMV
jgi:pimeloyl-ACP methyl ester carboxylesterase